MNRDAPTDDETNRAATDDAAGAGANARRLVWEVSTYGGTIQQGELFARAGERVRYEPGAGDDRPRACRRVGRPPPRRRRRENYQGKLMTESDSSDDNADAVEQSDELGVTRRGPDAVDGYEGRGDRETTTASALER